MSLNEVSIHFLEGRKTTVCMSNVAEIVLTLNKFEVSRWFTILNQRAQGELDFAVGVRTGNFYVQVRIFASENNNVSRRPSHPSLNALKQL
jgi:hypothetical protein